MIYSLIKINEIKHTLNLDCVKEDLVLSNITSLLLALPPDFETPHVIIEDDGVIALDWTLKRHLAISVSFYDNGRMGYTWMNGSQSGHAMEQISDGIIPQPVLDRIKEIVNANNATNKN